MAFDRLTVTMDVEKSIVTLLITSTDYCKQVLPSTKAPYFENEWSRTVYSWVSDYFQIYGKAPDSDIRSIYENHFSDMKEEDANIIAAFLENLSDSADKFQGNIDFHIQRAQDYFKRRSVICLADTLSLAISNNNIAAAEKEIEQFRQVTEGLSKWAKPSDFLNILAKALERKEEPLLEFGGDLGRFIGPLQRGWLVFWMGPPKRGKSNALIESVLNCLPRRLRIVVFSHEMSEEDWIERFMNSFAAGAPQEGEYPYPVFDCFKNATNSCRMQQRRGIGPYGDGEQYNTRYMPCSICIGRNEYEPCISRQLRHIKARTPETISRQALAIKRWFEDNIRLIAYPAYSASVLDMERDLDRLAYAENFYPDVIIDDYIGAHAPGDKRLQGRDVYDFEAKHLKRIAQDRNLLVISAFQGNRGSIKKHRVAMEDTAEDIRIINHCDKVLTLNQSERESHDGIMRIGKAADRHMEWHRDDECTILQNLSHGVVVLDSKIGWVPTVQQKQEGDDE